MDAHPFSLSPWRCADIPPLCMAIRARHPASIGHRVQAISQEEYFCLRAKLLAFRFPGHSKLPASQLEGFQVAVLLEVTNVGLREWPYLTQLWWGRGGGEMGKEKGSLSQESPAPHSCKKRGFLRQPHLGTSSDGSHRAQASLRMVSLRCRDSAWLAPSWHLTAR